MAAVRGPARSGPALSASGQDLPRRGFLGCNIDPSKSGPVPKTFLISSVAPGGLAAAMDIQVGDDLVYIEKHLVTSRAELRKIAESLRPGPF